MKGTLPRQLLTAGLRSAVEQAIEKRDQKYGRQLATTLERFALQLRATLGGEPSWSTKPKRAPSKHKQAAATVRRLVTDVARVDSKWAASAGIKIVREVCQPPKFFMLTTGEEIERSVAISLLEKVL